MADGFDTSEVDAYADLLLEIARRDLPKESKKFVQQEGNKLRKKTLSLANQRVKKSPNHKGGEDSRYHKNIKRGKVYIYKENGGTAVRVHSSKAPHAHLIEYGHRIVDENGNETGTVKGKYVFEDAAKQFESEFNSDIEDFLDEALGGISK